MKCEACKKGSGFDGCARVVCSMRKPITAQVSGSPYNAPTTGVLHGIATNGGIRKTPTNKEDYDA